MLGISPETLDRAAEPYRSGGEEAGSASENASWIRQPPPPAPDTGGPEWSLAFPYPLLQVGRAESLAPQSDTRSAPAAPGARRLIAQPGLPPLWPRHPGYQPRPGWHCGCPAPREATSHRTGGLSGSDPQSDYDLEYECYQEDFYDRVYDYQRVPASITPIPHGPNLAKRSRTTSSSLRHSRDRLLSKSSSRPSSSGSSRAKLKMDELQTIKRELTLIKVQIDGLLDNLDRMDRQRRDRTGRCVHYAVTELCGNRSGMSPDGSPSGHSPPRRIRRDKDGGESLELGEASDDDRHTMNHHSSDLEDDM
ncbi:hypothetical protein SKAU_G00307130 [Synaphobranchus kaupii]|uniref:RNA-binding Raly-like protein n=1 Tax=Synaphobranchus kaupii TaxID=118154 RepID=A0A9Q1EQU5_SYNKA|nr:hypothetical protein SKAU_G00307130 [Synaphobranchus kaupii]